MKKSVILLISVVYIISIVLVGFIGQAIRVYDEIKYVTDISVTAEGLANTADENSETDYFFLAVYRPGLAIEVHSYVYPEDADTTVVEYYGYQEYVDKGIITVDNSGYNTLIVTFNQFYSITFKVKSTDGKEVSKSVELFVVPF